eukprot:TRINITY_DN2687_c0_g2_i1.p1 TRINITY_DN2687_c0_g2~~TRINITY_DN2687_c0_g2_i1.p1  ORF type:complete len:193 (-),score=24.71 TRINITY_DN2687_c0_g2_i1:119-697(-)
MMTAVETPRTGYVQMDQDDVMFVRGSADRYADGIGVGTTMGSSDAGQRASTFVQMLPVSVAEECDSDTVSPAFLRPLEVVDHQLACGKALMSVPSVEDSPPHTTTVFGSSGITRKFVQRISIGGWRANRVAALFALALLAALISRLILSTTGSSIVHAGNVDTKSIPGLAQTKRSSFLGVPESTILQDQAFA